MNDATETFVGAKISGDKALFLLRQGKAILTLRSLKTGMRYTYKVSRPRGRENAPLFVSVLTGSNNDADYSYMGILAEDSQVIRFTQGSRVTAEAPSAKALMWALRNPSHANLEWWHEGRCCRCGRRLTVPESIESGLGPECMKRIG